MNRKDILRRLISGTEHQIHYDETKFEYEEMHFVIPLRPAEPAILGTSHIISPSPHRHLIFNNRNDIFLERKVNSKRPLKNPPHRILNEKSTKQSKLEEETTDSPVPKTIGSEKSLGLLKTQYVCQPNIVLSWRKNREMRPKSEYTHQRKVIPSSNFQYKDSWTKAQEILEMRNEIRKEYKRPYQIPPRISAKAYIVCEVNKEEPGKFKKVQAFLNSKHSCEIASLTKIMTCLIVIKLIEKYGVIMSEEKVKIGKFESSIGGTSAGIQEGEEYTVLQLLYGLMLPSGNDASLALAVWGGRVLLTAEEDPILSKKNSFLRFVKEMNSQAQELKMTKSQFANSHGLSNTNNKSCAFDVALMTDYCMRNTTFQNIVSCREFNCTITKKTLEEETIKEVKWVNTHKLLQARPNEYIGVKTGITETAGPCLCSFISKDDRNFIIVVLNCKNISYRFKETEILKNWLYNQENIIILKKKPIKVKISKLKSGATVTSESDTEASIQED